MDEVVVEAVEAEVLEAEPQVALVVEPHRQGVPVRHHHPLPEVELPLLDQVRPLLHVRTPHTARDSCVSAAVFGCKRHRCRK
eukprot:2788835-Rhodomonas_salina.2